METPSSTRRVTRSQTMASANSNNNIISISKKSDETDKKATKSRQRTNIQQQDRSALVDITNDSPIVGLAMGNLETPSSEMSKKRVSSKFMHKTPGSGEALLRGQVKTLLQKVEEEAELSKIPLDHQPRPLILHGIANSPTGLLAPTPANTPHLSLSMNGSSHSNLLGSVTASPVEDKFVVSDQMVIDGKMMMQAGLGAENVTRTLLLDFSENSEVSDLSECSSVVTSQGIISGDTVISKEKAATEDDDSSIWSIQVNASTEENDDEEEEEHADEEFEEECYDNIYYDQEEEFFGDDDDDGGLMLDELCDGISKISVKGRDQEETRATKFSGKHTRFVYNSDDELVEEVEEIKNEEPSSEFASSSSSSSSAAVLRLKELPTPRGRHLRFPEEEEE